MTPTYAPGRPRTAFGAVKTADLGRTRTFKARTAVLSPEAIDRLGRLAVLETKYVPVRPSLPPLVRLYSVELGEWGRAAGVLWVELLLLCHADGDVHAVTLASNGRHRCSCESGRCRGTCGHIDALVELLASPERSAPPAPETVRFVAAPPPKSRPRRPAGRRGREWDRPGEFADPEYEPLATGNPDW